MLRIGSLSAWIAFDGCTRQTHDIQISGSGRCASGWIASETDKNFSVNWYNSRRDVSLEGVVRIDGVICNTHIMLAQNISPHAPDALTISHARTSHSTRRDFVFTPIQVTDSDDYLYTLDNPSKFGVIELALWRIAVSGINSQQPLSAAHLAAPTLEQQVLHERSKRGGDHHVRFGDEYTSTAPRMDMVNGSKMDAEPIAIFTFRYRPLALLMADGTIPRAPPQRQHPQVKQEPHDDILPRRASHPSYHHYHQ
ncbi:hypothetical protein CPB85DRAFT_1527593 [Mucidula mucida]|nr:hypothetical protein CPB85DRAFT_1527593 [Mucidula mucida]